MGMNLDTTIRSIAKFMNASWPYAIPLLEGRSHSTDESSIADWLQANWEVLVERKVLNVHAYLEIYGEGADFHGASSRITDPGASVSIYPPIYDDLPGSELLTENNTWDKVLDQLFAFVFGTRPTTIVSLSMLRMYLHVSRSIVD